MIKLIDSYLNSFTMYRVVLYGLLLLVVVSILFGFTGIVFYSGIQMIFSLVVLAVVCFVSNILFSKLFRVPTNTESFIITSLILFFLLSPPDSVEDYIPLAAAGVIAMASKYVFAFKKHHLFNPAAFGVFIVGVFGSSAAVWWVATPVLLPFTVIVGLLIVRKIRKFSLLFAFILTAGLLIVGQGIVLQGRDPVGLIWEILSSWPIIFFATVMLTEPLTMPSRRNLQIIYGFVVGVFFSLQFQIGPIYSTPELALLLGNIASYVLSPKKKVILQLKDKVKVSSHVYDFIFTPNQKFAFQPGQYLEWTLPHGKPDTRGNRRYFTIASSPTEKEVRLGVRVSDDGSSFKKALLKMSEDGKLTVGNLSGDFVLPEDKSKKLVFIAGGIGITPFRSMVKFMIDTKQRRDIVLFYASSNPSDFLYEEIFERARDEIGMRVYFILTSKENAPANWKGKTGYITESLVREEVPDFGERIFYLSGPQGMVDNYKRMLRRISVPQKNIVTDYFPGF